jgi:Xaa-Pro aminopeptidase
MNATPNQISNANEQFARRVSGLRERMQASDLTALLVYKMMGEHFPYGGIGYARYIVPWTSPPIPPALILVPLEGDVQCLLMEGLGADHLDAPISGLTVRSDAAMAGMYRNEALDLVRVLADVAAALGLGKGNVGVVLPNELPVWLERSLRERLPTAQLVDATPLMDDMMMVKSAEEVEVIGRGARLADLAFRTVFNEVRVARHELEIAAEAHCAVLQSGAAYADIRVSTGRPGSPQHGVRPSTMKAVEAGDHIHVGVDINCEGYWVNVVKRGVVGIADPLHKALYNVAVEMQAAAIHELQPGHAAGGAASAAMKVLDAARPGLLPSTVKVQRLGHGIGLENQERPFLIREEQVPVRAGMTFAVHAGFSVSGGPQVANGDIVLITAEGPRRLTTFPSELVEVVL